MSDEQAISGFLKAFRRLSRQVSLYPKGHPQTEDALAAATDAANTVTTETHEEAVLAISGDSLYVDRVMLPHASLEYNGLIREMLARGIVSVSLRGAVTAADLYDLASFVGDVSEDLPADGTIRLNEAIGMAAGLEGSQFGALRSSYVGSLDSIRTATQSLAAEGAFELHGVVSAVESMLDVSMDQSAAALLLATVTSHDEYTFYHSVNTCLYSLAMGRIAGVDHDSLVAIGVGSVLHDIGKTAVSTRILNYPGRLGESEWAEVAIHPQEGALAILSAGGPAAGIASTIAFEHHVQFKGGGYPSWSDARTPHPFSRLVSVVDVYDAITTRRAYRRAETPNRALRVLLDGAGTRFDPDMVKILINLLGLFPPGSILRLRDGSIALVTHPMEDPAEGVQGVIIRDPEGEVVEPEPIEIQRLMVVDQLLADEAGLSPAAVLEEVGAYLPSGLTALH